jgi:hypothetical protein
LPTRAYGSSWDADLVGHDGKLVALRGEPADRQQEILAAQTVHPTRAQHDCVGVGVGDRALAFELALSVDVQRRRRRVLRVRCRPRSVEHVVGGKMNEHRQRALRLFRENARGASVDRPRQPGLDLRAVDGGVGPGIHDGGGLTAQRDDRIGSTDPARDRRRRVAERCEELPQFAADLPPGTGHENRRRGIGRGLGAG